MDLFDYYPSRNYWLGWVLAPFRIAWKAIFQPIHCEPNDRPIVLTLWFLMLATIAAPCIYFFGPVARTETLNYVLGGVAMVALILTIWLGAWGNDLEEFGSNFHNPSDPDSGGPYSGDHGRDF